MYVLWVDWRRFLLLELTLCALYRWGNDGLEFNQNEARQVLCNWLDKAGGVALFDFVTKGILNEAVKNTQFWRLRDEAGKAPGLLGWWPSRTVTFIDNHDTGLHFLSYNILP